MKTFNEKRLWFSVKHKRLAQFIKSASLVALYTLALWLLNANAITIIIVDLVLVAFALLSVSGAPGALMKPALESYSRDYDPYPLLNITAELLKYVKSRSGKLTLTINHCAALSTIGEYEKVIELLEALNIEGNAATPIHIKFIYYNNLADAYYSIEKYKEMEIWYNKSAQVLESVKNKKLHAQFENIFELSTAQYCIANAEYSKAMEHLCRVKAENDKLRLNLAFGSASANIGLGDTERAKRDLMFVIGSGKKVHIVKLAREMLEKLG